MKINRDKIKYGGDFDVKYDKVPSLIKYDNRLTFFERILMINFSSCSEEKYTPTIKSLSKQFDVSETTTDKAISNLKEFGYISTSGKRDNTIICIHPSPLTNEDINPKKLKS